MYDAWVQRSTRWLGPGATTTCEPRGCIVHRRDGNRSAHTRRSIARAAKTSRTNAAIASRIAGRECSVTIKIATDDADTDCDGENAIQPHKQETQRHAIYFNTAQNAHTIPTRETHRSVGIRRIAPRCLMATTGQYQRSTRRLAYRSIVSRFRRCCRVWRMRRERECSIAAILL